jgi:hypothetical protein
MRLIETCGIIFGMAWLAGCAAGPPPSRAAEADAAACTAQADATYNAQNYDQLSRTSQNGLYFSPTPNHVFDAQQQGALHVRDSQITACEAHGGAGGSGSATASYAAPLVTPHIVPNQ